MADSPGKRVTQQDIAKAAGVTTATVSMALRNDRRLLPETRRKIKKLAQKLGYHRDPMLSALAQYRRVHAPAHFQGVLSLLVGRGYEHSSYHHLVVKGAHEKAKHLGYRIEVTMLDADLHPIRFARTLRNRGINGMLFVKRPDEGFIRKFPWRDYSIVSATRTWEEPEMHMVNPNQTTACIRVWSELIQRGYRRIGIVLPPNPDRGVQHRFSFTLQGLQNLQKNKGNTCKIPPLFVNPAHRGLFESWYRQHRPDAVIALEMEILDLMKACGSRVPQDVGFASLHLPLETTDVCGNRQPRFEIGETAVEMLDSKIRYGDRGIPQARQSLLLDGRWVDGKTLLPRTTSGANVEGS